MIRVNKKEVLKVLNKIKPFVPRQPSSSILACCKLEQLQGELIMSYTDLDFYTSVSLPVIETGEPDFECLVVFSQFNEMLKLGIEDTMLLTPEGSYLCTSVGDQSFKIKCESLTEFPAMKFSQSGQIREFDITRFCDALRLATPFAAQEDSRYVFNGVFMASNHMVATHGKRLAVVDCDMPGLSGAIIPTSACKQILALHNTVKVESAFPVVNNSSFELLCSHWMFKTALIQGQYPDYTGVVPDLNDHRTAVFKLTQEHKPFLKSCLINKGKGRNRIPNQLVLDISEETVSLMPGKSDGLVVSFDKEIPLIANSVGSLKTAFDADFIMDYLNILPEIEVNIIGETNPAVIKAENFLGVLVPMRL